MNSLKDYQCLVLETLEKKQSLWIWKADLIGLGDEEQANELSRERAKSESGSSPETAGEHPQDGRQTYNASPSDGIELQESHTKKESSLALTL